MDSLLRRKESLVVTAIDIIDDLGIQGLSTRELAKREGVSEGTLFRHFKTKNDILSAVLDHFSQYDSDIMETTELCQLNPIEALTYFLSLLASYYENYPEIIAVELAYDGFRCDVQLEERFHHIFNQRNRFIREQITRSQHQGMIRPGVDADNLTDVIAGFYRAICVKWHADRDMFSLKDRILAVLKMVLDAFTIREEPITHARNHQ